MAITATRYTPYVEVEFHTADQLYAVSRGGGWGNIQPTRDLISIQTNKELGSPTGTWQLTLTGNRDSRDGMDWYDRLTENDLVVIKMGRPPEIMGTVMVGLIDEIRRTKSMGGKGEPTRQVLVRGSDFGKVLTRAQLRFYPALANDPDVKDGSFYATTGGWQAMLNFFIGSDIIQGDPGHMMKEAMIKILFRIMNMNFQYWDNKQGMTLVHLANILRFRFDNTPHIIPFLLTMLDYEGAFWNFIERVSIKPFNELFVDTRGYMPDQLASKGSPEYMNMTFNVGNTSYYPDGDPLAAYMKEKGITQNPNFSATFGEDQAKVILFLRNTPFDADKWNTLYTHTVQYAELISEDLGRSDAHNYNTFMAFNSINIPTANNLKLLSPPVIDADNAAMYGMNPLEVQVEGISIEDDKINAGIAASQAMSQQLYNWYHRNKDYKEGTATLKGNAFYKVGQRLIIKHCEYNKYTKKWDDLVFYIEGVSQNFTVMDSWTTTLVLTRGQRLTTTQ